MNSKPEDMNRMMRARFALARKFGSAKYTRFVILAYARSGSNFLLFSLRDHPAVIARGEVFRFYGKRKQIDKTFCRYPSFIEAAGLKIFHDHPTKSDEDGIWEILRSIPDLHVISLTRRNLLRTVVSNHIGRKTLQWTSRGGNSSLEERRVQVDPGEIEETIRTIRNWEQNAHNLLPGKPWLDMLYEDLVGEPQRELEKVREFLKLSSPVVATSLEKQNPEPLSELVLNYSDLHSRFAGTEWEWALSE